MVKVMRMSVKFAEVPMISDDDDTDIAVTYKFDDGTCYNMIWHKSNGTYVTERVRGTVHSANPTSYGLIIEHEPVHGSPLHCYIFEDEFGLSEHHSLRLCNFIYDGESVELYIKTSDGYKVIRDAD